MTIRTRIGDIAEQPDLEAVVNAANAQLVMGGGVAGALHRAAGPELAEACRPMAPLEPGQAAITDAFGLANRFVIHVLGPRYGIDTPSDRLLEAGYRNALSLCREHAIRSVGFPALSAGAFGYPLDEAARIAVETVRAHSPEDLDVVFVLFDRATERAFSAHLA